MRVVLTVTLLAAMSIVITGCEGRGPVTETSSTNTPTAKEPAENVLPRIDPSKEKGLVSTDTQIAVELTVRNKTKSEVTLHWLDETDGARIYYKDIPAGEEIFQGTFESHYWIILDKAEKPLGIYKATDEDGVIVIK